MQIMAPAGYAISPFTEFTAIDVLPRELRPITLSNWNYNQFALFNVILQSCLEDSHLEGRFSLQSVFLELRGPRV